MKAFAILIAFVLASTLVTACDQTSWSTRCTLVDGKNYQPPACTTTCMEDSKIDIATNQKHYYEFEIPKTDSGGGATIAVTVLSGDVKVYVRRPSEGEPSDNVGGWTWSSEQSGQEQTVIVLGCNHWTSGNCQDLIDSGDNKYGILIKATNGGIYRIAGTWDVTPLELDTGFPQRDSVERNGNEFFKYKTQPGKDFTVDVTALSGYPWIHASFTNQEPKSGSSTYSKAVFSLWGPKRAALTIPHTDFPSDGAYLYMGILGWASAASFTVVVTGEEPLTLIGSFTLSLSFSLSLSLSVSRSISPAQIHANAYAFTNIVHNQTIIKRSRCSTRWVCPGRAE